MTQTSRPDHYGGKDNPYECIKVMREWMSDEEYEGFLKGNILKYTNRVGKKAVQPLEDATKISTYAQFLVSHYKEVYERKITVNVHIGDCSRQSPDKP